HHFLRFCHTHETRKSLRSTCSGNDADLDLRLAESRVLGGQPEVAGERQLAPTATAIAVNRGDRRLRKVFQQLPPRATGESSYSWAGREVAHRAQVGDGTEGAGYAVDDQTPDVLVVGDLAQGVRALRQQLPT